MAVPDRSRSALATVVGWLLAIVVIVAALRFLIGSVAWIVRSLFGVIVIVGLVMLYLWLKAPSDD